MIAAIVVLDCTEGECTLGHRGERYQTRDFVTAYAMQMLQLHVKNHEVGWRMEVSADFVARVKPGTVTRPKLS